MRLAGDSDETDEKIQAFRAAQPHTRWAQQLREKANSSQELLNLQSLPRGDRQTPWKCRR